ncbi:MAG: YkgJ family cysteine cluster protein [Myxococcales bacterium]|nr:YkgJ family cysteine cluster protein [Myxococcales bacterium]
MEEPEVPDCRACGVCCREGSDGRILVSEHDLVRWRREGATHILDAIVPGHFGQEAFASTPEGACVHQGTPGHPNDCSIYETRGETCRSFEAGSRQCLEFRRRWLGAPG